MRRAVSRLPGAGPGARMRRRVRQWLVGTLGIVGGPWSVSLVPGAYLPGKNQSVANANT